MSFIIVFIPISKNANDDIDDDIIVAVVDGENIYNSEIEFVFDDVNQSYDFPDEQSKIDYKNDILENAIAEIVVINEALSYGLTVDENAVKEAQIGLSENMGDIYQKIIDRYGEDRYYEDLKKRWLIGQMKDLVISNRLEEMTDDEFEKLVRKELIIDREIDINAINENKPYLKEYIEEPIYLEWLKSVEGNHDILINYLYDS